MNAKDAIAEVLASQMKHDSLDVYHKEKELWEKGTANRDAPDYRGTYEGCQEEAETFIQSLEKRGFTVVPLGGFFHD